MSHALLLAGGKSSRMGRDKSALSYRGKTLLEHALALLDCVGCDDILISGEVSGHASLPDRIPGCGPLGGLHTVLHHLDDSGTLDNSALLVIPVDMPLLDTATVSRLLDALGDADSCHYEGEVFPCVFRASRALMEKLDNLFADSHEPGGARSIKALLAAGTTRSVPVSGLAADVFLNLNNPEDWQRFLAGQADR